VPGPNRCSRGAPLNRWAHWVEAMPYQPSRLVQRAWSTNPRCLSGFKATPLTDPPASLGVFDELGYFAIGCECGGSVFRVLGHVQLEGFVACPLSIECTGCGKLAEIFDVKTHGYDAELGNGCYSIRGDGPATAFSCPDCNADSFVVWAGFSYQIEPIEDLPAEAQDRAQDLFDWFYLTATCSQCDARHDISDYECA
jgi:hypothetical protein